jgi:hypothetical protein
VGVVESSWGAACEKWTKKGGIVVVVVIIIIGGAAAGVHLAYHSSHATGGVWGLGIKQQQQQ